MLILPEIHYDLDAYVALLERLNLISEINLDGHAKTLIKQLEYNSRNVVPGTLFVCKGANFKEDYLTQAIEQGAVAYVSEKKYDVPEDVPYILVRDIREAMAPIASFYHNDPQNKLNIIAIGGTKGKSTTAYFVKAILDRYLAANGKKPAGLISTIDTYDGEKLYQQNNTTPEAIDLQAILARAVDAGLEYLVMEVSSQALKYHRTDFVEFDVSIFLNIDEDHISPIEHHDFEDYLLSKALMFNQTKKLVINRDTKEADYLLERAKEANEHYTFSIQADEADYFADAIETVDLSSLYHLHSDQLDEDFELSMPGHFNIENAVAATAAVDLLGIPVSFAKDALKEVVVPGRMRIFSTKDSQVIAVVDYAHNRLSFESLITSMKEIYPDYRTVSVFGAPGGKALGRRQELGQVAGQYSDDVFITMDDPGTENVADISKQIAEHVEKEGTPFTINNDRTRAIQEAFAAAEGKTLLLIIGKGQDDFMIIGNEHVPMRTDEEIVTELIENADQSL